MDTVKKRLATLARRPQMPGPAYDVWLRQHEIMRFLEDNAADRYLVVYATIGCVFLNTVFVPERHMKGSAAKALAQWNGNAYSSWGVVTSYGATRNVSIEAPLRGMWRKPVPGAEQLVFVREFEGLSGSRISIELLQRFVHASGIHFVRERNAWCVLDGNGDVADVARIVTFEASEEEDRGRAVLIDRSLLDRYATLTRAGLARMADITCFTPDRFSGWQGERDETSVVREGLIYRQWIQVDASFSRGVQLIASRTTQADLLAEDDHQAKPGNSRFASFIAQDWKNNRIKEISCAPEALANYFTKSDLPFEVTPAFFRAEVLLKYKADTQKYTVESRSISCRGAWHLQSYDINEAGQVHTYLVYLQQLPYQEQLYWRSFNEAPKAPISKRALQTDIKGEFSDLDDPLEALRGALADLDRRRVGWWRLRDADLLRQLTTPVTAAADEWANDLMTLDKAVVEGLEEKWLRVKAKALGRSLKDQMRRLKLLEECLIGCQFEADHARALLGPLHEVHNLRSEQKGHPTGDSARRKREEVLAQHGRYSAHFQKLCEQCLETLAIVDRALSAAE